VELRKLDLSDLETALIRIEGILYEALKRIGDRDERIATLEHQFKELEKWHKRMWVVTSSESKMRFLENTSGFSTKPSSRLKVLKEAKLTQENVKEMSETFERSSEYGKRAIALDYWVNMKPAAEIAKEHEITSNYVQQRAHMALRKIKHRMLARKVMGKDAPH
jgi:hypothetical protein